MRVARVLAQAKINLFLRVLGRQPSGFHQIITMYQRIDLADEIVVRVGDSGSRRAFDASGPQIRFGGLGPPEKNLAFRAAVEYAARTGRRFPKSFSVELTKNIPVGGGLGGGSADAGAVLRALNALAPEPMDPEELQHLAASLGADVPFLTSEHVWALGTGHGEQLAPHSRPNPPAGVLIVVLPFSISTADAYRWLDEDRADAHEAPPSGQRNPAPEALEPITSPWEQNIGPGAGNDFEPVVEKRHPELRAIRERLGAMGARLARLAGSGSCVFGIFDQNIPDPRDVALDAHVIPTRTSSRVVQVEVLE